MGFSRQEYWSGLLFPSPGDPPNSVFAPGSPALQAESFPSEPLCVSFWLGRVFVLRGLSPFAVMGEGAAL